MRLVQVRETHSDEKSTSKRLGVKGISDQDLNQRWRSLDLTGQEGAARQTKKEFINYLHIAQGSLSELDTQLEIARRLQFLDKGNWDKLDEAMHRVDKMLTGLIRHQRTRSG